jgi:hypothetical protein
MHVAGEGTNTGPFKMIKSQTKMQFDFCASADQYIRNPHFFSEATGLGKCCLIVLTDIRTDVLLWIQSLSPAVNIRSSTQVPVGSAQE